MRDYNPLNVIAESLNANGVQGLNIINGFEVEGTLNGEVVKVTLLPANYCKVSLDGVVVSNMSQPYNVGEAARLRRFVGMFENVTAETTA